MITEVTSSLDAKTEWPVLRRWIDDFKWLFVKDGELRFFHSICCRTLRFNKYVEHIPTTQFLYGIQTPHILMLGAGVGRRQLWVLKRALKVRRVLYPTGGDESYYLLNLPGILQLARTIFETNEHPLWGSLQPVYEKVCADYEKIYDYAPMPVVRGGKQVAKLEELMEEALQVSTDRRDRLLTKSTLTVQDIQPVLRLYCEEIGITYSDLWTKRDFASAKNWLNYCTRDGIRPRRQLRDLVRNWTRFRQGQIHNDEGKVIMLRETVSFTEYFKWRKAIDAWLAANQETMPEPTSEGEIVWEQW